MTTSTMAPPEAPPVLLAEDLSCPPRFATPRTPERKTLGGAVAMCAEMLGLPLMEWQRYVLDVLLEIDPETGEFVYTDWLLTVPRQSGKSTLILAKSTHRATDTKFFGRRQVLKYAAQSRVKAKEKFEKDYVETLEERPRFASRFAKRTQNGSEEIVWWNKSRFGIESATKKAGHGTTIDEAYVDEAFAQPDGRLEDAFEPAMSTRRNKQLGLISTMGWRDTSTYFNAKVAAGRKLVAAQRISVGARHGTAVFEWSAPDDADPGAVATWLATMPALHRPDCNPRTCRKHTQRIATVQASYDKAVREKTLASFRRAYLNQSVDEPKVVESETLPSWSACGLTLEQVEGGEMPAPVAIGLAVSAKGAWSSIGAAGWWEDRTVHVGPVDRRRGTEWIVAEALRIQIEHECAVLIREDCPDAELPDALEAAGVVLTRITGKEWAQSCSMIRNRVDRQTLTHLHDRTLDEAVVAATWKSAGTREVLAERVAEADVSMLQAVAIALHGCDREADPSVYLL